MASKAATYSTRFGAGVRGHDPLVAVTPEVVDVPDLPPEPVMQAHGLALAVLHHAIGRTIADFDRRWRR